MIEYDYLIGLRWLVEKGKLKDKTCKHDDPPNPKKFCAVCFVINLSDHAGQDSFADETTERQRKIIRRLWKRHS